MTLQKDLERLAEKAKETNPYVKHSLLRNPFPGYGESPVDVCTNQESIRGKFIDVLQNFSTETKRLRINGETGAGKTNILRYFERLTNEARLSGRIRKVYPMYIKNPGESYFDIHGQIVEKLSELFLGDLLKALQSTPDRIDALLKEIKSASELLTALNSIVSRSDTLFAIYSERHEDIFIRWLKAQKLAAADKKLLTYDAASLVEITSPSLAIRFLHGLLAVLKALNLCDGIVLLFDEFEEIFVGLSRARQSRYAQDLRHLFDLLKESVFFVVATVPEPRDLSQYPAIERRLGAPEELQAINNLNLAFDYVKDYLNSGREKFEAYQKAHIKQDNLRRPDELEPLTKDDVELEFCQLNQETEKAELEVLPGYFLPRMRERVKQIVEDSR